MTLSSFPFRRVYRAGEGDLTEQFYVPALNRSSTYDRAVGYFRSSIFHLVGVATSDFASKGGRIRLVCSTSLEADDVEAVREGKRQRAAIDQSIASDIRQALEDPRSLAVTEFLATLVAHGALEVRVAYNKSERGIFHTKVGIFRDADGNVLTFEGSINETFMAWAHNEERFKVFRNWVDDDCEFIDDDRGYFEDLWADRLPSVTVRELPEVALELLRKHAAADPQAAAERVLATRKVRNAGVKQPKRLQGHQLAVMQNWIVDKRGIIDHVTGGGKTISAIACIRAWLEAERNHSTLVLVPSDVLSRQWRTEIQQELAALDPAMLMVGGSAGTNNWREQVGAMSRSRTSPRPRIIIATMDTSRSEDFRQLARIGSHSLLVADEVHAIGAPERRKILDLEAGARLGLSATPERYGDPEGTAAIKSYFGPVLQPRFTIRDAQAADPPRLVPYVYSVSVVELDSDELEQYERLSKRIGAAAGIASEFGSSDTHSQLTRLCIERARILKSARQKAPFAASLLADQYEPGSRWLVYCDNTAQLNLLSEDLEGRGIRAMRYTSAMDGGRDETLAQLERSGGVVLSMKCLDEGVDIPNVTHALILASSLNPREHLQRRGRVLRSHPGKTSAYIFDVLVGATDHDGSRAVFASDIERARKFASDASNARQACWHIDGLTSHSIDTDADIEADVYESASSE